MTAAALRTPTAVEVLPAGSPRDTWLDARQNGIGGSDVPGIVGLSDYASPWQVYLDKLGELPDRRTDAMDWGLRLEPVVRDWFTESTGITVTRCGLLANVDRPWQIGSIDGETGDGGVLEVKTTSVFRAPEWADGQIPDDAELQTQHYLDVTGYDHAWVAVLIGGQRPELRRLDRDDNLIGQLRGIEAEFWSRVVDRRPPPVDGLDTTRRVLNGRWPHVDPDSVRILNPADLDPLLARRALLKEEAARVKRDLTEAENRLRALIGDAEYGVPAGSDTPAVTWRWRDRAGYEVAPTRYRQLTVKEIT